MAAIDPINAVISLFNNSFTALQTFAAFKNTDSEVEKAARLLATFQARLKYAKELRDRAFDTANADTIKDQAFKEIQTAISNLQDITTESSRLLWGSKASVIYRNDNGTKRRITISGRFRWVLDGKTTFHQNISYLEIYDSNLSEATDMLRMRLVRGSLAPALPVFCDPNDQIDAVGRHSNYGSDFGRSRSKENIREKDDEKGSELVSKSERPASGRKRASGTHRRDFGEVYLERQKRRRREDGGSCQE
ncbi:hypothetical protein ANO14919_035240 [Xylariales sp. No.14919]|nr:hypothetical protein ANO14919_035240 [Xylariales sp. No.14919]